MRINGIWAAVPFFTRLLAVFFLFQATGCVPPPAKKESQDSMVLREFRIEIEDLRHKLDGFVLEMQILEDKTDARVAVIEGIREELRESQLRGNEDLLRKFSDIDSRMSISKDKQKGLVADIRQLLTHANETSSSLDQQRKKVNSLEADLGKRERRLEEKLSHLKTAVGSLINLIEDNKSSHPTARIYKVKEGDSLDRIARAHKTSIEDLKQINHLDSDLIVIGQELKLP
jgi:LysM repeat protein